MNKILGIAFGELFNSAKGIIDESLTTDEERLEAEAKLKSIFNEAEINAQQQVTSRWEADMASDNKLSKNIRPMTLIFMTVMFVVVSFLDGNFREFSINADFIPLWQNILLAVYGSYFVGRTIEKVRK